MMRETKVRWTDLGAALMMLSTLRIISAASEALSSTCRFTWKDSVMPSSAMLPTVPSDMSAGNTNPLINVTVRNKGLVWNNDEGFKPSLFVSVLWFRHWLVHVHSLSPKVVLFSWCAALS